MIWDEAALSHSRGTESARGLLGIALEWQSNWVGSSPVIGRPQGWRWRAPAFGG